MKKSPVYLAGDMLYEGSQLLRELQKQKLEEKGIPVYSPKDDKEINDKQNQTLESNSGLAERIVFRDTLAIKKATHCTIEPQRFAEGTLVELGQIKAYNEMRQSILDILNDECLTDGEVIDSIYDYLEEEVPHKKVYAHLDDIRRTDIPEVGDRRSFYVNQYVYGVVLELTNGVGFKSFEEIAEELREEFKEE